MADYTDLIAKLKEEEESKLTEEGTFFEEVTENAKTTLENLLTSTGETQDYKVIFK